MVRMISMKMAMRKVEEGRRNKHRKCGWLVVVWIGGFKEVVVVRSVLRRWLLR